MINSTAYDTTLGSAVHTEPIQKSILKALTETPKILDLTLGMPGIDRNSIFITGEYDSENNVPLFTHPIQVFKNGKTYIASDLRLYLREPGKRDHDRIGDEDIESRIRNRTEYNLAKSRHAIQALWSDGRHESIGNSTRWAATVFASWIADALQRSMALNYLEAEEVRVVAIMYYHSLFTKDGGDDVIERNLMHTAKAVKFDSARVFQTWDQVKHLQDFDYGKLDVNGLCDMLRVCVSGGRLNAMNAGLLVSTMRNSWYGTNAKDIILAALEHPPTWLAVLYTALHERSYKTTAVAKLAENLGRRGLSDEFEHAYVELVRQTNG